MIIREEFSAVEIESFKARAVGLGIETLFFASEGDHSSHRRSASVRGIGYDKFGSAVQVTAALYSIPGGFTAAADGSFELTYCRKGELVEKLRAYGVETSELAKLQNLTVSATQKLTESQVRGEDFEESESSIKVRRSTIELRFATNVAGTPELIVRPCLGATHLGKATIVYMLVIPAKEGVAGPLAALEELKQSFTVVSGSVHVGER